MVRWSREPRRTSSRCERLAVSLSRFRVACVCVIYQDDTPVQPLCQDNSEHFFEKCLGPPNSHLAPWASGQDEHQECSHGLPPTWQRLVGGSGVMRRSPSCAGCAPCRGPRRIFGSTLHELCLNGHENRPVRLSILRREVASTSFGTGTPQGTDPRPFFHSPLAQGIGSIPIRSFTADRILCFQPR